MSSFYNMHTGLVQDVKVSSPSSLWLLQGNLMPLKGDRVGWINALYKDKSKNITFSSLENTEHITILVIVPSVLSGITLITWL